MKFYVLFFPFLGSKTLVSLEWLTSAAAAADVIYNKPCSLVLSLDGVEMMLSRQKFFN